MEQGPSEEATIGLATSPEYRSIRSTRQKPDIQHLTKHVKGGGKLQLHQFHSGGQKKNTNERPFCTNEKGFGLKRLRGHVPAPSNKYLKRLAELGRSVSGSLKTCKGIQGERRTQLRRRRKPLNREAALSEGGPASQGWSGGGLS